MSHGTGSLKPEGTDQDTPGLGHFTIHLSDTSNFSDSFFWKRFLCGDSPDGDVEDVAAHGAGHGHVPQTFTGHDDAGDQVGDGRPGCQDGQAHYLL